MRSRRWTCRGLLGACVGRVFLLGVLLAAVLRWTTRVSCLMAQEWLVNHILRKHLMGLTVIRAFTREPSERSPSCLEWWCSHKAL